VIYQYLLPKAKGNVHGMTSFAKCYIVIILIIVKYELSNATFELSNHAFILNVVDLKYQNRSNG
jgi:hypothetical protein